MISATGAFRMEPFLETEREQVEAALRRVLGRLLPFLPEGIGPAVSQGVLAGGKRLRPILCVAAFSGCRPDSRENPTLMDSVYDLAVCVELIHAYSLMHDDLPCMDDAPLRRGIPTPHTVYGEISTMHAGLILIPLAGLQVWTAASGLGLGPTHRRSILRVLSRAAGAEGMVGGQALDLLGEGRVLVREELDDVHRRKTGALLTASARLGATAAGASSRVEMAFERYGDAIGLAFQIADDVLDATADAAVLGKNPSDRDLEKSTYVRLLGVEAARVEADRLIEDALEALREVGALSVPLEGLAWYVARRDR